MPRLEAFRATRFTADQIDRFVAPPYDVISPDEREELAARSSQNLVHVTLPAPDASGDPDYRGAGDLWSRWLKTSVLVEEDEECLFLYLAEFIDGQMARQVAGMVGCIELVPLGGGVHPHEMTRPGPKRDRLELMKATSANLEPLWFLASQGLKGIDRSVEAALSTEPLADVTDVQGVRHRLWRASDPHPPLDQDLVIADGHHRYETSLLYRDLRRGRSGTGPWDSTLALVMDSSVLAPKLLPIHRLAGVDIDDLSGVVDLQPREEDLPALAETVTRAGPGSIGVHHASGSWIFASEPLDTTFLADRVLAPLGVEPEYEHNLTEVSAAVKQGATAFLLAPIQPREVIETALSGARMPPKTTLFWPKPLSGLVMRAY